MIKVLVTDFFNEIEKRELKKNKNAQAIFWVEELQKTKSIDKNHISVKKATRLYDKYVLDKEKTIVKEPNKYLLDFMSQYLGFEDFQSYQLTKESKGKLAPKKIEQELFLKKHKKTIIVASTTIVFAVLFLINKHNNMSNDIENCIVWKENYFEKSTCSYKNTIDNSIYKLNIEKLKKVKVTSNSTFFENGKPIVWYGKSNSGKMEFFTHRGIHYNTLRELKPITEHIINKYVIINEENKTILK